MTRRLITAFARYAVLLVATALTSPLSFAGPQIETWETSNGAAVVYVHAPEIAMFDVRVTFAAGSARDGAQKGIAKLTSSLLQHGADDYDADTFASAIAATGAQLSSGARRDMAYVSLRTLVEPLYSEPALALAQAALARPRFDNAAVERQKARAMIGFRHKQQSPASIADDTFYERVYGDHPYATSPDGLEATVAELTRADLKQFHQRYYVARNAVIAIVGAIDQARARTIAEGLSAALPAGEAAAPLPAVAPTTQSLEHVEHSSIQSHVRVGLPGMNRTDADYFPLLVGNHALGGNALVSLLFEEVRSKRGLSYSAHSYFAPMAQVGPFVAILQTDRSQRDEALKVLNDTLAAFIAAPPADAIEAAKQNLIGGFPLRIDSNQKIIEYLSMIRFYDLPLDYLEQFTARVAAVTLDDIQDAFERRVRLDQLVTVIVGRNTMDNDS